MLQDSGGQSTCSVPGTHKGVLHTLSPLSCSHSERLSNWSKVKKSDGAPGLTGLIASLCHVCQPPWGLASRKEDLSIGTKRGADVARNSHLCSLSVSRGVSALPPALYFCGLLPAHSSRLTMLGVCICTVHPSCKPCCVKQ